MDEDNGQREADQITQSDMDDFYGRLGDELDRQRRIKNCWIIVIIVLLAIAIVLFLLFGGG